MDSLPPVLLDFIRVRRKAPVFRQGKPLYLAMHCKMYSINFFMATLTKTLKLPFLRLNQAKAAEFARLQELNTKLEVHAVFHKDWLEALLEGRANAAAQRGPQPHLKAGEEVNIAGFETTRSRKG